MSERHHVLCNGDPRSPVRGCTWCLPEGRTGLLEKYPMGAWPPYVPSADAQPARLTLGEP